MELDETFPFPGLAPWFFFSTRGTFAHDMCVARQPTPETCLYAIQRPSCYLKLKFEKTPSLIAESRLCVYTGFPGTMGKMYSLDIEREN